ncbi:hypothetical protein ZOSMA_49G00860 [Zostera marina]|uniref:Uncharacterized protein n=1 Tax=Zostera marina TaxID=29655 RepID=A0A0K9P1B1_ZOSMR|nr:hypothetical protein ZOSMA_49G00860 [Zostera marina]
MNFTRLFFPPGKPPVSPRSSFSNEPSPRYNEEVVVPGIGGVSIVGSSGGFSSNILLRPDLEVSSSFRRPCSSLAASDRYMKT